MDMEKRYLWRVSSHPLRAAAAMALAWSLVPEQYQDDVDQHVAVQALVGQGLFLLGEGQACIGDDAVVEQRVPALATGVLAAHLLGQARLLVVVEAVGAHVVEGGAVAARAAVRGVSGAQLAFLGNVVVAPPAAPVPVPALLAARGRGGSAGDGGRAPAGALLHAPKRRTRGRGRVDEPGYVRRASPRVSTGGRSARWVGGAVV